MSKAGALVLKAQDPHATLSERHEAFAELVRSFQDMAYACAYGVLGDFQLAEDIAQEAFISAWQKLPQLRQPDAFPGWFKRIVITQCNRHTRRKQLALTSLEEGTNLASQVDSPESLAESKEQTRMVLAAIAKLSENDRLAVVLFYLKQHSHSEIAEFLEVPTTTIAKRLYSARIRLASLVTQELNQELMAHRPSRNETFKEKVSKGIFDEYVGEYVFDERPDLPIQIRREGNKLISISNGQTNELAGVGDVNSELATKEFDGRGRFVRDSEGRVTHFVYYEFGNELGIARKIV